MSAFRTRLSVAVVILATFGGPATGVGQQAPGIPPVTGSIASLEISTERGNRVGSGVIVGAPHLVVTSFRLVQGASRIRAVFENNLSSEVTGIVAARQGSDLALLRLRQAPDTARPLPLAAKPAVKEDPAWLHAGIRSLPTAIIFGKVRDLRSGDEQAAHWEATASTVDCNGWWIVTDVLLPPTGMGGALLTPTGELLGVMVGPVEKCDEVHVASDAAAIAALLQDRRDKPLPLASLRKHEDDLAESPPAGLDVDRLPPNLLRRRLPVKDRLDGLRKSLLSSEQEVTEIRRRQEHWRDEEIELSTQAAKLNREVDRLRRTRNDIRPEERKTRAVVREYVETDSKGRSVVRSKNETEEYYEYSDRQRRQIAELSQQEQRGRADLEGLRVRIRISELQVAVARAEDAGQRRYPAHLWNELFWLADPLELRSSDSAREFLDGVPRLIDALGTLPPILVARAVAHLRLRQFDECEADLEQGLDLDRDLLPVAQAIRARIAALQDSPARAKRLIDEATRKGKGKGDVRVLMLQSRMLLEHGDTAAAVRQLKRAQTLDDSDADLLAALAIIHANAADARIRNPQQALRFARQACDRTGWQDGLALLSLAGAAAAAGDFQNSGAWLELAADRPVGIAPSRFDVWRQQLAAKERLSFEWSAEPAP